MPKKAVAKACMSKKKRVLKNEKANAKHVALAFILRGPKKMHKRLIIR
jgi:hypothetical protein